MTAPSLPIVLIGPMAAGKSTTGRALAERLGVRLVPLDAIRWYYHLTDGFSFSAPAPEGGFAATVRRWEPYSIAAVQRALQEFPEGVHDLGAGHAHYEIPEHAARLEEILGPLPNVFLILPCADLDRAREICATRDQERLGPQWDPTRVDVNEGFLRSECFRRVAKHTVHVEERTVEQVVDEIVGSLR